LGFLGGFGGCGGPLFAATTRYRPTSLNALLTPIAAKNVIDKKTIKITGNMATRGMLDNHGGRLATNSPFTNKRLTALKMIHMKIVFLSSTVPSSHSA
jgi:hypothetical protein